MFSRRKKSSATYLRPEIRKFVRQQRIERTLSRNLLDGSIPNLKALLAFFLFNFLLGGILILTLGAFLSYHSVTTRQFNNLANIDESIEHYTFVLNSDIFFLENSTDFAKVTELMDEIMIERYFKKFLILVIDGESGVFSSDRFLSETRFIESTDIKILTLDPKLDYSTCSEIVDAIGSTQTALLGQRDFAQKIGYICNNMGAEFFFLNSQASLGENLAFEEFLLIYLRYLLFPVLR